MKALPPLLFLHLDRSGGTSVLNALRTLYERAGQHFTRTDTPAFGVADCIAGHFPFHAVCTFTGHLACTVLRDPVERELSALNKTASPGPKSLEHVLRLRTAEASLERYIDTFIRDGLYASRYTCGTPTLDNARCVLDALDLVGVTVRLDAFWARLLELLDAPLSFPLARANASSPVFTFNDAQRAHIRSRLPDDTALYEHALNMQGRGSR